MNVFSLFPNTRGVAYSFVQIPQRLMEYGVATSYPLSNKQLLERVEKLVNQFKPDMILVRAPIADNHLNARINDLIQAIITLAKGKGIPIEGYTREQIKSTFEIWGLTNKYEISQRITQWFPQLADYARTVRKSYEAENHCMGIFDSIALISVYIYLM